MALMSGADPGPAATANPFTLFSASNAAARYLCNMKKKDTLAPLNADAINVWKLASAEAAAGNLDGLRGHYADLEKSLAARFMQYSLIEARAAAQKLKTKELEAADACRSPCVREAQQVGRGGAFGGIHPPRSRHGCTGITNSLTRRPCLPSQAALLVHSLPPRLSKPRPLKPLNAGRCAHVLARR
jgi:hypothetical protein